MNMNDLKVFEMNKKMKKMKNFRQFGAAEVQLKSFSLEVPFFGTFQATFINNYTWISTLQCAPSEYKSENFLRKG